VIISSPDIMKTAKERYPQPYGVFTNVKENKDNFAVVAVGVLMRQV